MTSDLESGWSVNLHPQNIIICMVNGISLFHILLKHWTPSSLYLHTLSSEKNRKYNELFDRQLSISIILMTKLMVDILKIIELFFYLSLWFYY
jgi:hypothetical protein